MKYTLSFRVWHWLNALVIIGLLGTVFLRKTFLSWRDNAQIIMSKFSEMGVVITKEQAKVVAQTIRDGMWEWHIILGYALAFLVLYRIYLFFRSGIPTEESYEVDEGFRQITVFHIIDDRRLAVSLRKLLPVRTQN